MPPGITFPGSPRLGWLESRMDLYLEPVGDMPEKRRADRLRVTTVCNCFSAWVVSDRTLDLSLGSHCPPSR